jgi:uncharacterized protein YukE
VSEMEHAKRHHVIVRLPRRESMGDKLAASVAKMGRGWEGNMNGREVDVVSASYAEGVRDGRRTVVRLFRCLLNDLARKTKNTAEALREMERIIASNE